MTYLSDTQEKSAIDHLNGLRAELESWTDVGTVCQISKGHAWNIANGRTRPTVEIWERITGESLSMERTAPEDIAIINTKTHKAVKKRKPSTKPKAPYKPRMTVEPETKRLIQAHGLNLDELVRKEVSNGKK